MKYSVVIFPSSQVQEVANSYRKRYDPTYALIPPFIRLKEAFDLEESALPQLVDHLEQVASSTDAFSVRFHRVSTFHPTNNVIYLGIQNKEPFEAIHQKIMAHFAQKEVYAFVPHLTIGRDLADDELKDVVSQLSMAKIDLTTLVDRFHLVYQLEDGTWTVYQTFLLQK
ncbi:2'-5' RNA ligase family protein [Brevibacillus humidisoli]|uniref:2'-5' RNA ligase family protein n=1 Tax=Brevibacillus humidisoli TaxID=2895522 RepID=UPI001E2C6592|nr:2'-5' RNA ligase family protein [Brevibacillus humidisoli]UFJ41705.1 2'-5' RNA ligase family protein [Brevibacillus humidisoli]